MDKWSIEISIQENGPQNDTNTQKSYFLWISQACKDAVKELNQTKKEFIIKCSQATKQIAIKKTKTKSEAIIDLDLCDINQTFSKSISIKFSTSTTSFEDLKQIARILDKHFTEVTKLEIQTKIVFLIE